eukprot:TRINITY_DN44792_c0_g1_i2.p1 TRINITY_DN44792_c0_g1~~TRINITY_DN44792_c0_g1_i2.p1  ORF type:complete len:304 (+),score=94.87 TRINITY_DN44792_c0_g1_i2:58-969(+)
MASASGVATDAAAAMDWPLSREEKKGQLLKLYQKDVQAADSMIESRELALAALRDELEAIRRSTGCHAAVPAASSSATLPTVPKDHVEGSVRGSEDGEAAALMRLEAERLRQVVETAAAVLRAVLPTGEELDADGENGGLSMRCGGRSRSEGALRDTAPAVQLKSALSRTPRTSRCGTPKRRVSFGGDDSAREDRVLAEPEPEDATGTVVAANGSEACLELTAAPCVATLGIGFKQLPPLAACEELVIRKVTRQTWADEQGIRPGDLLLRMNDVSVAAMTGPQFLKFMKARPLRLSIERRAFA